MFKKKNIAIVCMVAVIFMALFLIFESKTENIGAMNQTQNQSTYENHRYDKDLNTSIELYKETLREKGYCGDGVCNPKNNENKSTCCVDCGCEENFTCKKESCVPNIPAHLERTIKYVPKLLLPRPDEYPYQDTELSLINIAKEDKKVQDITSGENYFVQGTPIVITSGSLVNGTFVKKYETGESGEVRFEVENKVYKVKIKSKKVTSINISNDTAYNNILHPCLGSFFPVESEQKRALEAEGLLEKFRERAEEERKKCIHRDLLYNLAFNSSKVKDSIRGKDFLIAKYEYDVSQDALTFRYIIGERGFPGTFDKGYEVFVDGNSRKVNVQGITNKTEVYHLREMLFGSSAYFYIYGEIKNQTKEMEKIFISLDDVA